ncbi:kinetochore protein Nuf2 [Rhizophagus clarus]|nr:kinetochore protein Nuf2 [Rhizophagus clarus]
MQNKKESWMFPTLTDSEIVYFFDTLKVGISLTDHDLKRPMSDRICDLYAKVLEETTGGIFEQFDVLALQSMQEILQEIYSLDYQDIYTVQMNAMSFYIKMRKFMQVVGISDFNYGDIIRPEPQRLRMILSGIINYMKFREDQIKILVKMDEDVESLEAKNEELENSYHNLNARLNALKLQRKEQEPEVKRYKQDNENLMSKMRELKKKQTGLLSEIDNLKASRVEWTDKINNSQFLHVTAKQNLESLKSRIVLHPEKLKQTVEEMNNNLSKEREDLAVAEKSIRETNAKLDMLKVVEDEIKACNKTLDEVLKQRNNCDKAFKELRDLQEDVETKRQILREIEKKEQLLTRQKQSLEERLKRQRDKHRQRVEESENKLATLHKDYEKIQEEMKEYELKAAEEKRSHDEIQEKIINKIQCWEKEKVAIESQYKALTDKIDSYEQELLLTIKCHKIF